MGQLTGGTLESWMVSLLEGFLVALLTDGPLGGWLVSGRSSGKLAAGCGPSGRLAEASGSLED